MTLYWLETTYTRNPSLLNLVSVPMKRPSRAKLTCTRKDQWKSKVDGTTSSSLSLLLLVYIKRWVKSGQDWRNQRNRTFFFFIMRFLTTLFRFNGSIHSPSPVHLKAEAFLQLPTPPFLRRRYHNSKTNLELVRKSLMRTLTVLLKALCASSVAGKKDVLGQSGTSRLLIRPDCP